MKLIPLTNSTEFAIIDDEDFYKVIKLSEVWNIQIYRNKPKAIFIRRNNITIYLHRFVMGLGKDNGYDIDHISHNIFDNRKENLRIATFSQNQMNKGKYKNNRSGHKNIRWHIQNENWNVYAVKDKKQHSFGSYETLEEAIKVRNIEIPKLHGEFARLD